MKVVNYIKNIFVGIWHLGQGMYVTMLNFCRPKVTQQYPENRGRREYGERFRALLTMPHDAENHHKCIACGMCMNNCPNGTIQVVARTETDPATGKPKRVLDKHLYNLGSCIFCGLPGSSQAPKPAPAPKPAAPAPEGGTASPEARTESKTE